MTYKHTQIGTVVIVAVLSTGFVAILSTTLVLGYLHLVLLATIIMLAAVLTLFYSLTVEIDSRVITCRFGVGIIQKQISLSDIDHVQPVTNPWYVGWGIRWIPGRYCVWNVSGLRAVELVMKNGKRFRIGTDEPEMLAHAIETSKRSSSN